MEISERKKRLGDRLRVLREASGYSLRELSAECGIEYSQIHRIEQGQISPTVVTLEILAEALKVSPAAFFD